MLSADEIAAIRARTVGSCSDCGGYGHQMELEETAGGLRRTFVECECIPEFNYQYALAASQIPPKYHDFELDNYSEEVVSLNAKSISRLTKISTNFKYYESRGKGLLITGPPGTGKTAGACAVAMALFREGKSAYYTKLARLINMSFDALSDKDLRKWIRDVIVGVDVLIVDEADKFYNAGHDLVNAFLDEIFGLRYEHKRVLLLISNVERKDLKLSEHILDRFEEMLVDTPFRGESFRKKRGE